VKLGGMSSYEIRDACQDRRLPGPTSVIRFALLATTSSNHMQAFECDSCNLDYKFGLKARPTSAGISSHRYMCGELIALLALKLDTHTLVLVATKSFDHLMYGLSCLAEYSTPAKRSATLKYDPVTSATPNLSLPSQYCFDYPAFLAHRHCCYRFPHLLDHYQEY
jgi:hypothetical protein